MKKVFYSLLCAGSLLGFAACSNGDYNANPDSVENGAVNPITPLTSDEYNWGGTDPMSAEINGAGWVADNASFTLDGSGSNVLVGTKDGSAKVMRLSLKDVWSGNLYDMGWKNTDRYGLLTDTVNNVFTPYYSYLGNSGGIKIIYNDTDAIKGMFYFKGVTLDGQVVTVNKGYFNIIKP